MTTTVMALQADFWDAIGRSIGAMWLYAGRGAGADGDRVLRHRPDHTGPAPDGQADKPNAIIVSAWR